MLRPLLIRSIRWQPLSNEAPPAIKPHPGSVAENILEAELSRTYSARISSVEVGAERITIRGQAPGTPGPLTLAEIPMDRLIDDPDRSSKGRG